MIAATDIRPTNQSRARGEPEQTRYRRPIRSKDLTGPEGEWIKQSEPNRETCHNEAHHQNESLGTSHTIPIRCLSSSASASGCWRRGRQKVFDEREKERKLCFLIGGN
ncbi:hypothetical protein HanIR_Chr04g0154801 [Helianthus annuus]|nr:hypothetical protein HanIR_Chr04g0154801 [Helianthus annuus]